MKGVTRLCTLVAFVATASAHGANTDELAATTGRFTLTFTAKELLGEAASEVEAVIAPDEAITWEVYVPEGYRADAPPGLLVYISPTRSGRLPYRWNRVMDERNLIWIGANQSGNWVLVRRRILMATLAVLAIERGYVVDRERFYISGLSGGGKAATMLATSNPNLFAGGVFFCGAETSQLESPGDLEKMQSNRYVFLTGERDTALGESRRANRAFRKAGVRNTRLMVIRGMGHSTPEYDDLDEAIDFLDTAAR
ncbi:MAG: hypothetical protein OEY37_09745 [Gammaproteobacteria bacterium]|nr:hypothetical protein [Gammaproteobacteria bacterium]